jgi:hypothetical protein
MSATSFLCIGRDNVCEFVGLKNVASCNVIFRGSM